MSLRDSVTKKSVVAVSANKKELHYNQGMTLDTSMHVDLGSIPNWEPRRETNADEMTGHEEPTTLYDLGGTVNIPLNFPKAQPQHFAFLLAYALGSVSTAAAGSGYEHTITPIDGDLDNDRSNPSFTLAFRAGDQVFKRLACGCVMESVTVRFNRDDWAQISGQARGSGKTETNIVVEEVAGQENATSVTLAKNAVEGGDAATRLSNVHSVRWKKTGDAHWQEVTYTAVSGATPAVITIQAVGSSTDAGTFEVTYVPDEDTSLATDTLASDPPNDTTGVATGTTGGWTDDEHNGRYLVFTSGNANGRFFPISDCAATAKTITCEGYNLYEAGARSGDTFKVVQFGWLPLPSKITETPLRVQQFEINFGGKWNGSAFQGGRTMSGEIKTLEWTLTNTGITPQNLVGSGVDYATGAWRETREQTLSIDRRGLDARMLAAIDANEEFGLRILAEGAEFDTGHKYTVDILWPKLIVQNSAWSNDGKRLAEKIDLAVLEDDTYGSVRVRVKNLQATYAA